MLIKRLERIKAPRLRTCLTRLFDGANEAWHSQVEVPAAVEADPAWSARAERANAMARATTAHAKPSRDATAGVSATTSAGTRSVPDF